MLRVDYFLIAQDVAFNSINHQSDFIAPCEVKNGFEVGHRRNCQNETVILERDRARFETVKVGFEYCIKYYILRDVVMGS